MLRILLLLITTLLLPTARLQAQLRVEVDAPANVDITDSYFQIRYRIATDQPTEIQSPRLDDFDRLSGPNISMCSSTSTVNGRTTSSSSTTYTFTLAPKRNGKFTISGAAIRVGGRTYKAAPVTIRVTGNGRPGSSGRGGHRDEEEPLQSAGSAVTERDLYLTADASTKRVYEQEPVLLTYKFYQRLGVGLNSVALTKKPDFKGMVSEDIPVQITPVTEHINGNIYRSGIIQQYLVTPQQSGRLHIPGLTFDCVVVQRESDIDQIDAFFNGTGHIGRTLSRTAPDVEIEVLPLPSPRPADFTGGVGRFTVRGELLTESPRTNDMVTYRVTISGTGNLKMLTAPTVTFPGDFDTYPAKTTPDVKVTRAGVTGSIVFDYTFVPRAVGLRDIPAIPFTYFDPETAQYVTATIPACRLDIRRGERSDEDVERERRLMNGDLPALHAPTIASKEDSAPLWGTWPYWLLTGGITLGGMAFILLAGRLTTRRKDGNTSAVRQTAREIRQAEKRFGRDKNAAALYGTLLQIIGRHLPENGEDETRIAELVAQGTDERIARRLMDIYDRCRYARYAPGATDDHPLDTANELLDTLNAMSRNTRKRSTSATLLLIPLLLLTGTSAAAGDLRRADSLYTAGRYAEAVTLYENARAEGWNGKDLYYNLGLAYYQQRDYVHATVNLERALRIDPADKDAVYALRLCRTHVTMPSGHRSTMFFITWADRLIRSRSADSWGWLSLIALGATLTALGGYRLLRRRGLRKLSFAMMFPLLLTFLLTQTAAALQAHHFANEHYAVVATPTPLTGDDGSHSETTLMPGVTVRILSETDNLIEVELPVVGIDGWIAAKDVERVN